MKNRAPVEGLEVQLGFRCRILARKFMSSPGRIFTLDNLCYALWGEPHPDNSVRSDIWRLRKELRNEPYRIETVKGIGYRMIKL